jgi:hypothetical protein
VIDANTLDAIRNANPLADVLARDYGLKVLPHGAGRKRLLCIFHSETDASLVLNENSNTFKCFGCGEHGDVFKIVMKLDALTFPQAVEKLAKRAGIRVHGSNGKKPAETRTPAQPKAESNAERDLSVEWRACVTAFTDAQAAKLATWRGYSADIVTWLRNRELVGLHEGKVAFPVRDDAGRVVALHYREMDGTWRYHPTGCKVRPLLIGDTKAADVVLVFESQWDAFAVCGKLPSWTADCNPPVIVTRGASNGGLARGFVKRGASIYAFRQNDVAAEKWLADLVAAAAADGATVRRVVTPDTHKDVNEWTKAGATANDLYAAMEAAVEVKPVSAEATQATPDVEWPEPKPLPNDLPAVPAFDFACLPDTLRPWLEDIAERMQCPPDFPAVAATVALGSLVGRKIGIRPKRYDDWLVVPNLWGAIVGRPGLMKTPAAEQALSPLRRLVAEALERYEAESGEHKITALLKAQRVKLHEREIAKHLKDGDEASARAEAKASATSDDSEPKLRRYEVNDSTVAKLGELLAENPNGLLVHRDELIGFLRGLDKEGAEESRAFYLESWNGTGSFVFDRIGRGTVRVESNTLAILGGIQPDLLTAYVREAVRGGMGADGLLQRFQLAVWPDIARDWRNVDRWPDTEAKNKAFSVFKYLDGLDPGEIGADVSSEIAFLRFDSAAQDCFDQWRARLETKLRDDSEHPAFEAHLSKYRKLVPALALLIHLADRGAGHVTLSALEKALRWATYLEHHARRIYSAVLRHDTAAARELAKHLQRGELAARFNLREVYRRGWAGLSSKEDAEAATEILCDLGWIRPAAEDSDRKGGRPASPAFEVNPKIRHTPPSELTELTKGGSVSFGSEAAGGSGGLGGK